MNKENQLIISILHLGWGIGPETLLAKVPHNSGSYLALDKKTEVIVDFTTNHKGEKVLTVESDIFPPSIEGTAARTFPWNNNAVLLLNEGKKDALLIRSTEWQLLPNKKDEKDEIAA